MPVLSTCPDESRSRGISSNNVSPMRGLHWCTFSTAALQRLLELTQPQLEPISDKQSVGAVYKEIAAPLWRKCGLLQDRDPMS